MADPARRSMYGSRLSAVTPSYLCESAADGHDILVELAGSSGVAIISPSDEQQAACAHWLTIDLLCGRGCRRR